jgi:thiol-disulfide isomerase/thioredoxin
VSRNRNKSFLISAALTIVTLSFALIGSANPKSQAWKFSLPDIHGKTHSADEWKLSKAITLFFIATECPISNRYAPEINRIASEYSTRNVIFYAVHSDPDLTAEAARLHAVDFGYQFTVLLDPEQLMASRIGVTLTPTAVILSPQGGVLYRGRIDNRYVDFGKYRDTGIKPDLRLALDALLAGKAVSEPVTKSIGCALPPPARNQHKGDHEHKHQ